MDANPAGYGVADHLLPVRVCAACRAPLDAGCEAPGRSDRCGEPVELCHEWPCGGRPSHFCLAHGGAALGILPDDGEALHRAAHPTCAPVDH